MRYFTLIFLIKFSSIFEADSTFSSISHIPSAQWPRVASGYHGGQHGPINL